MATTHDTWTAWNSGWWDRHGALGGVLAGGALILYEVLVAWLTPSAIDILHALRLRGAMVFGPEVIDPDTPAAAPAITGLVIHLSLGAVFGLIFGMVMARWGSIARSLSHFSLVAAGYGLALWLINFYVLAPAYGWPWFPEETNPIVQAPGHSLFFGIPLALILYRMLAARRRLGLI